MQLIAESGSTKTEWTAIEGGAGRLSFKTSGFNPMIQDREQICEIIKNEVIVNVNKDDIKNIYFYGAGCSTEENIKLMFSGFKSFFNMAEIEIHHDLLGAARGLWGNEAGIVAILGTGSNSCVYDGNDITFNVPSLGYIIGDEGSGAYLGKQLVRDYLYGQLPEILIEKLRKEYQLDKEKVFTKVYKQNNPNRWLASFSIFIRENFNVEYCQQLVYNSINDFFRTQVSQYKKHDDLPLGAVGSIAWLYKDIFTSVAQEQGFKLGKIIRSPMEELVKFHTQLQGNPA